ncbi:MAG TPA: ATP-binding protein [Porphyromonadaceae bacterium]|nr:ATP-binding protein [Porphyromonadaceae bacterium]
MNSFYESRQWLAYLFVAAAVLIAVGSLVFSHHLVRELAKEERNKIEIWASATQLIASGDENADMSLVLQILQSNSTIPVILYDSTTGRLSANNITLPQNGREDFLQKKIEQFSHRHPPIELPELNQFVYYDDSYTLKKLRIYPYVQLFVIAVFIAFAFFALNRSQKAEQNKLWVGLSKETAHQLGTPISSLVAWTEYLKLKKVDPSLITEIEKDLDRLQSIAERFSKIGSVSDLKKVALQEPIQKTVGYLRNRLSDKVEIVFEFPSHPAFVLLNESLFGWVIENLTKNAADAMSGQGMITFSITEKEKNYLLDITDTGKGIPKSKFKRVFQPGFTTKERGWGHGLSLSKRIVEMYHHGKIFVKRSEADKGTTFRIVMKKSAN